MGLIKPLQLKMGSVLSAGLYKMKGQAGEQGLFPQHGGSKYTPTRVCLQWAPSQGTLDVWSFLRMLWLGRAVTEARTAAARLQRLSWQPAEVKNPCMGSAASCWAARALQESLNCQWPLVAQPDRVPCILTSLFHVPCCPLCPDPSLGFWHRI